MIKHYLIGWSLDYYTKEPHWCNATIIRANTSNEAAHLYMNTVVGNERYNPLFQIHIKELT